MTVEFPRSTLAEAMRVAAAIARAGTAELVPVDAKDERKCHGCRRRRAVVRAVRGTLQARFCAECVDAAKQYGLVEHTPDDSWIEQGLVEGVQMGWFEVRSDGPGGEPRYHITPKGERHVERHMPAEAPREPCDCDDVLDVGGRA